MFSSLIDNLILNLKSENTSWKECKLVWNITGRPGI